MNKIRLDYNGDFIELSIVGFEHPTERWMLLQGAWSIGGREMSGRDPSIEFEDMVWLHGQLKDFLHGDIQKIEGNFIEPNFTVDIDKNGIAVYFLPESSIWKSFSRPEAEKIIYGEVPIFRAAYRQQDVEALLAWSEAVLEEFQGAEES